MNDLKDIIPYAKGIILYGSFAKGYADEQSDIDICIIKKKEVDAKFLYEKILYVMANKDYDIVMFNMIPWYLRGEILENGKIVYAEDMDELEFWIYKQLKIWKDMKRRQKMLSTKDLINRLKA